MVGGMPLVPLVPFEFEDVQFTLVHERSVLQKDAKCNTLRPTARSVSGGANSERPQQQPRDNPRRPSRESAADLQFMDRFNEVGVMETCPAFDRTLGWQQAFAGDLEGFRSGLEQRGISQRAVDAALDLRERGHRAPNLHAARREAREWVARQSGGENV